MAGTQRRVVLDRMTPEEFGPWRDAAARHFAGEKVRAGDWAQHEALTLAMEEYRTLLPEGVDTPDQHVFTVRDADSGERVAVFWLALRPVASRVEAFIYDIEVHEKYRGQGYGRATMLAGIEKARELRADTVGLHVFGDNETARNLYRSLGFAEIHVNMSLDL